MSVNFHLGLILSEGSTEKAEPRWWKPYWLAIILVTLASGALLVVTGRVSFQRGILFTGLFLAFEALALYGRTRSSITLNRLMYVFALGAAFIGGIIWIMFLAILHFDNQLIYFEGQNEVAYSVLSVVICFSVGALIGDIIGRKRHYKGPERYQP